MDNKNTLYLHVPIMYDMYTIAVKIAVNPAYEFVPKTKDVIKNELANTASTARQVYIIRAIS